VKHSEIEGDLVGKQIGI